MFLPRFCSIIRVFLCQAAGGFFTDFCVHPSQLRLTVSSYMFSRRGVFSRKYEGKPVDFHAFPCLFELFHGLRASLRASDSMRRRVARYLVAAAVLPASDARSILLVYDLWSGELMSSVEVFTSLLVGSTWK